MSYTISIKFLDGTFDSLPVATNGQFNSYWIPIFEEQKCSNLENLHYFHEIEEQELKSIIEEMEKIKPKVTVELHFERLEYLLERLRKIDYSKVKRTSAG